MIRILLLIIGYGLGLLQTAWIYGKLNGIDIRKKGSGNSGATNTLRVLGKKAALVVFLGDLLKCMIPCLIVRAVFSRSNPDYMLVYMQYLAIGVILGHNFPFYLNFKGGKGISSTSGFILAYDLRISGILLAVFIAAVAGTRYVSLGSLLVVSFNLILTVIFLAFGLIPVGAGAIAEFVILMILITGLAWYQHRANVVRLIKGTENKLGSQQKA